jgi:hypothetical protein
MVFLPIPLPRTLRHRQACASATALPPPLPFHIAALPPPPALHRGATTPPHASLCRRGHKLCRCPPPSLPSCHRPRSAAGPQPHRAQASTTAGMSATALPCRFPPATASAPPRGHNPATREPPPAHDPAGEPRPPCEPTAGATAPRELCLRPSPPCTWEDERGPLISERGRELSEGCG